MIIGGAQIFIHAIDDIATRFDVSHLVFALLVAPIATELPEALNSSVIWARRGKDVLALGNITGAMVFQATFPVSDRAAVHAVAARSTRRRRGGRSRSSPRGSSISPRP